MSVAFIGLGSNLDDPATHVLRAFSELSELRHTSLVARSSLYSSKAVGYDFQPNYVNAVAKVETTLSPTEMLQQLLEIEAKHGRVRTFQNAPRTLDLDLLIFGELIISDEALKLPHPRMHQRAFVLHPLLEIEPNCQIPGKGPANEWLAGCLEQLICLFASKHISKPRFQKFSINEQTGTGDWF